MTTAGATFAVVTGGGTSGHVLAAVAVADALVARGHDRRSIHYVGATRGVERRLLPSAGYDHTLFDVVGLQRARVGAKPGLLTQAHPIDVAGDPADPVAVAEGGRQRRRVRQLPRDGRGGVVPHPHRGRQLRPSSRPGVEARRASCRRLRRCLRRIDAAEGTSHRCTGTPRGVGGRPTGRPARGPIPARRATGSLRCSPSSVVRSAQNA